MDQVGGIIRGVNIKCGYSTTASMTAFQAVDGGSIPLTRSENKKRPLGLFLFSEWCDAQTNPVRQSLTEFYHMVSETCHEQG